MAAAEYSRLLDKVRAYNPGADISVIEKACVYGEHCHEGQVRASGESYFSHPIAVAEILADLKLDSASIITALLHDTVEDTDATLDDLRERFGDEVASLVDGVTKLTQLEIKSEKVKQAENLRKLVVAMSEDIRVLLVKLADRLHNMRTLHFIQKPEKRRRIAFETMEIYASLAERIGIRTIKDELQDIAFQELNPEQRNSIITRLEFLREEGDAELESTVRHLRKTLQESGVDGKVFGREKKAFSIWKKMEEKNVSFEQLTDIIAFRIIVPDVEQCYRALGLIHAAYHMIHGHFKDYISTPKPNGYKSLHTTVMGPGNQRIEIQIRTEEMHEYAEYGVAAHWSYKQGKDYDKTDGRQFRWIRELMDILEHTVSPEEFMEETRLEMYHDQVFCFTPRGDLLQLPKGSTPVDFAFAVHSAVGRTCVGARINGRIVPLRTQLENGDQVDIIRSKTGTPSPSWERFVVTGKARSEIRRFMREQKHEEYVSLGRTILSKSFQQNDKSLNDKDLEPALKSFGKSTPEDLYAAVGSGEYNRIQVMDALFPDRNKSGSRLKRTFSLFNLKHKRKTGDHAIPIKGLIPGMAVHFAGCCHPLPGDRIVGIVVTGKGISIHTIDCDTLENFTDTPERWIDVSWDEGEEESKVYVGRIKIIAAHEPGALAAISNVIAREDGNINNLKFINRSTDFFEIVVDIEVRDVPHLTSIIASLRSTPVVQSVERGHD